LEGSLKQAEIRKEHLERKCAESTRTASKFEQELREKAGAMRKAEEELFLARRDLEKAQAKAKMSAPGASSAREDELQQELTKAMGLLKCSTCKQQMRSHILTKCSHTFCKPCIDARLSTRQRKCPACNMQFAQSEVQQLYLQ